MPTTLKRKGTQAKKIRENLPQKGAQIVVGSSEVFIFLDEGQRFLIVGIVGHLDFAAPRLPPGSASRPTKSLKYSVDQFPRCCCIV
jgi:hypothetical protein